MLRTPLCPGSVPLLAWLSLLPHHLKMMHNGGRRSRESSPQNSFSSLGCPWPPVRGFLFLGMAGLVEITKPSCVLSSLFSRLLCFKRDIFPFKAV